MFNLFAFLNRPAPSGNAFPKWANAVPWKMVVALLFIGTAVTAGVTHDATPEYFNRGYTPDQPVAFDHSLHVGQLGMDCRYCHTFVEKSGTSSVPSTNTCWNCHSVVKKDWPTIAPIRESIESGKPIQWVKVHKLPDYVYFNHAVHVNRGVSCVECHGQVNEMKVVGQAKSLSMSFCLDCHRNPEEHVRPLDKVFDLNWKAASPEAQVEMGTRFVHDWKINPPQSCSGCHR